MLTSTQLFLIHSIHMQWMSMGRIFCNNSMLFEPCPHSRPFQLALSRNYGWLWVQVYIWWRREIMWLCGTSFHFSNKDCDKEGITFQPVLIQHSGTWLPLWLLSIQKPHISALFHLHLHTHLNCKLINQRIIRSIKLWLCGIRLGYCIYQHGLKLNGIHIVIIAYT